MKVLAIVGSPRLNGNTNYLVDRALEEAAKLGAHTEKIVLSQYEVNPCLGHDECASFDCCLQKDDAGWILLSQFPASIVWGSGAGLVSISDGVRLGCVKVQLARTLPTMLLISSAVKLWGLDWGICPTLS